MSVGYTAVQWNRHKRVYDAVVIGWIIAYIAMFFIVSKLMFTGVESLGDEVLIIRALGSCALLMLHIVLCIGPLARLEKRVLPLLYNRRHLGVLTFVVALIHSIISIGYYHGFGVLNPLVSLLSINTDFTSLSGFPFQLLGLAALMILFVLAATSHDLWLKVLSPTVWKCMHMLVYVAYALLVGHVTLGALASERSFLAWIPMIAGAIVVTGLHIVAGFRESRGDTGTNALSEAGREWIDAGTVDDIAEDRARTVCTPGGERIAIFKHNGGISAITNVCAHQGGPLGEGKVIDGCVTCPWHGWQYRPQDGCSPPPFSEKIGTYQVRIVAGRVRVDPAQLPPGTPTTPALIGGTGNG
jgi:sulfoxide reductase heme-binding subunit YedZ